MTNLTFTEDIKNGLRYKKAIVAGDVIEIYTNQWDSPAHWDKKRLEKSKNKKEEERLKKEEAKDKKTRLSNGILIMKCIPWITEDKQEEVKKISNRRIAMNRARTNIRRLTLANFTNKDKFVTLTFEKNVTDIEQANKEFTKFIKRLKRMFGKVKYIAVVEFQVRGAVHYHLMIDLGYVPNEQLREVWGQGFVKINRMNKNNKSVDNVGAYIVKYMQKDLEDPRLRGRKAYFTSRSLTRPIEVKEPDDVLELIEAFNLKDNDIVFRKGWQSEFAGRVEYYEFNLKRRNGE